MKKNLAFTMIAIACAALLLYGWTAFAATAPDAEASASVNGIFQSIEAANARITVTVDEEEQTIAAAKSVWVYRNEQKAQLSDLKPGDKVEIILNSKKQAAYVKASVAGNDFEPPAAPVAASIAPIAPTADPTQTSADGLVTAEKSGNQIPPASPPGSVTEAESKAKPKDNNAAASKASIKTDSKHEIAGAIPSSPQRQSAGGAFKLKVDGKHFKLQAEQKKGPSGGAQYDFLVKPERGGAVHLKGDQAAVWIDKLVGSLDLKSSDARQQLVKRIAEHYDLDQDKLSIQISFK